MDSAGGGGEEKDGEKAPKKLKDYEKGTFNCFFVQMNKFYGYDILFWW